MQHGGLPWLGAALGHGSWVAAGASAAVTPGAMWVLALLLERRRTGLRDGFVAVLLGDPLLAVAIGLGVARMRGTPPEGPANPWPAAVWVAGCLGFGLLQWRTELRQGFFTRAQALAPTKIWHQLVVYPLLGHWLWTAVIGGLAAPGTAPADLAVRALMILCVLAWLATNAYDRRHPKLGHPPYSWRRLRPCRRPWPATSTTLRAYRDAELPRVPRRPTVAPPT